MHEIITDGYCSGTFFVDKSETINGEQAAKELQKQGNDLEFFRLDENGNDIEE